jgi:hypothetical protein
MALLCCCSVGSNHLRDAKAFYDALIAAAGITPVFEHPSGRRAA